MRLFLLPPPTATKHKKKTEYFFGAELLLSNSCNGREEGRRTAFHGCKKCGYGSFFRCREQRKRDFFFRSSEERKRDFDREREQRRHGFFRREEAVHTLQREQSRRPGDAREIRAGDRDHENLAGLRHSFLDLVVEYPLDQGSPGFPMGLLHEKESRGHRGPPEGVSSRCRGRMGRVPSPPLQPVES